MKSVGLRIRIEPELRDSFIAACNENDLSAAQVLRAFMKEYVNSHELSRQGELFTTPSSINNNSSGES